MLANVNIGGAMEGDLIHINHWLRPFSWLYGIGVRLRNFCFDASILSQVSFDRPVICIGNLTIGGTGKTPHTEMLLRDLLPHHRVAVLSRGYKRQSKGFVLANAQSTMLDIGDEPWQMKQKFPDAVIAVDGNRRRGIRRLLDDPQTKDIDVILLDDAYQHRYVKAGLNILLTDYHRIITDDALLPAGRLREPVSAKGRANIMIVTKCPRDMRPMDFRVIQASLKLKPYQHLFFSTFRYGKLYRLFDRVSGQDEELTPDTHILLLTGIASPRQMMDDLYQLTHHITPISFPDHHAFSERDIQKIEDAFTAMQGNKRFIVTTEKDAARLLMVKRFSPIVRRHIYILPIEVEIMRGQQQEFQQIITDYVS